MHFRPQCVLCGLFTHFVGVVDAVGEDYTRMITEIGRGGACVPARVAPQGRIHRSIPHTQCVMHKTYFWYGNAAARMFGRARRHRPYGFVWVDYAWDGWYRLGELRVGRLMSFGWIVRGWLISFGKIVHKWLFCLCGMRGKI